MSKQSKLREKILDPGRRKNVTFDELVTFVEQIGFVCEKKASGHKVFTKRGILEMINLQPGPNGKAKPYQVRQVAEIVLAYNL